jgi:crotonobetainyl-CoA:carnitine CoA-transferase CaiB-like acyl-CoA transferase
VIGEAMSGLRHLTGDPDRPPARVAVSLTDYITGLYGAFGAMLALFARTTTGRGQLVDSALYECAFSFMEPHIPAFEKLGHVANRAGTRLPDNAPNNLYPTKDDNFIHIAAVGETMFRRLLAVMGKPALADDPRFRSANDRSKHDDALDAEIAEWTGSLPLAEIEARLHAAEVPASKIFTMRDIFADPHYRARNTVVDAPDAEHGSIKMAAVTPRLSETPGSVRRAGGGVVGADTREVLKGVLDMADSEIDVLEAAGVIACGSKVSSAA